MEKHRILKKTIAYIQLAILSIGFAFTALPMKQLISGEQIVAKADDTDSSSSSSGSGDSSDSSGNSSSNSKSDDTPAPIKNMEEKLGEKNNILNPQFPDGVKQAAFSKSGALGYNKQAQIAITYAILSSSYPAKYEDLFKTGESTAKELNSQLPGLNIPKMGTDTFVKQLSDATGDEGGGASGGQDNNPNSPTKAEEIETSSFPTDMNLQQMKQWKNKAENKELYEMMQPVVKKLADNAVSAVSISDKVDWKIKKTTNTDNEYSSDLAHHPIQWGEHTWENFKGAYLNGYAAGAKKLITSWGNWSKADKARKDNSNYHYMAYSTVTAKDWIGTNPAVESKKSDIEDAMTLAALGYKIPTMHSKKDLEKYLSGLSAQSLESKGGKNGWGAVLGSTKIISRDGVVRGTGASHITFPLYDFGNHTSKDKISTKEITHVSPDSIEKDLTDGAGSAFLSHYKKEMNATAGKVTVTDAQWQAFQKAQKDTANQKDTTANATNGDAVLSWSPAIPYSDGIKGGTSNGDLPGYTSDGGQLMKDKDHYATINGKLMKSGSILKDKGPWKIDLGGTTDAIITDGDDAAKAFGISGKSTQGNIIQDNVKSMSSSNIFGYDAYGDIIDGQSMKVVVPYWQNTTIKGIKDLKNPVMMTNMNVSSDNWDSKQIGCASVSNKDIEDLDKKDAKDIEKVRDAIKGASSQRKAILAANKAVGGSSNSSLNKKAAACVAVLITANTSSQIGAYNKDYLSTVQKSQQCYIGESIDATKKNKDTKKGTGLYTAADVIQRFGLMTDYGLANMLRKTLAGFLVSTYNEDFVRNQSQNVFATEVFGTNDELAALGVEPYFWVMIVIDIMLGIITAYQYYEGKVKWTAFVTRFLKALVMIILFGLIGYGVIPQIEQWILNAPITFTANKIIKRESVLDMWDKLREQKQINNVFYEDLMQDNFGPINRSMNYLIPFYTSTRQDGTIDPTVTDPLQYGNVAKNHGSNTTDNNPMTDNSNLANSMIYREGDGKVPPLTPYKYKKVYVSLMDLTNWASHMARQKLSAEGKPGFTKGCADYEAPADGYEPGQEPLFVWLAKDYQPIETSDSSSDTNSQDSDSTNGGLNGNNNANNTNGDNNNNGNDNGNNANADTILSIMNGTFDKTKMVIAHADDNKESTRQKIVDLAKTQIHKAAYFEDNPQEWNVRLDCSGLVQGAYTRAGIKDCPRTSGMQYAWAIKGGAKPESAKDAKPGDLGFLGPQGADHVVIYAGDGKVIQESDPQEGCNEKPVYANLQFLDMSKQIGAAGPSDSSSDSNSGDNSSNSSSDSSDGGGIGDYGTKRNPADTSPKSEMKDGTGQPQTGDSGNSGTIDNSEAYKNFDKYAEFAVNTKHYASKSALQYGIDTDSSGGQLTASQAFLNIWESCFENSGENGDPGDAQSFTALMNFADAMNKNQSMGDQTSDTAVGNKKDGNLSNGEVGSVGRNALINELSMTQDQRKELNGGQGGYSHAAQQMIDSFKIPAGKSDYFNLSDKNSIIYQMDPDQKVDGRAIDAIIYSVNKKVLNDYVTIYSTVRGDIQPTDANSTNDDKNNQADHQGVDPFTMAEDQVMAADLFFTINQKLGYRMFPTGYDAHSISLDSWNRMLFIPIAAMKQLDDNSQYDIQDKTDAAKIALQDNVVEYIALNSSILDLICFILMNFLLVAFGVVMKFFFMWFFPLFLFGAFVRYFVFSKGSGKGILTGSLFAIALFATMKFGLGFIFSVLSNSLNSSYTSAGGYTEMHVAKYSIAVGIYLLLCLWLAFKYMMFILNHFWTLGATADGNVIKGFGSYLAASKLNPFKRSRERNREKWRMRGIGRKNDRYTKDGIRSRINGNSNKIKNRSNIGGSRRHRIIRAMADSAIISKLSKGRRYFVNRFKDKDKMKYRLHNIINSRTGQFKKTESNGLNINDINSKGDSIGTHIDDVHDIREVKYDMRNLNDAGLSELADVIATDSALRSRFYVDMKNKQLVAKNVNDKMLSTPEGRKEIFAPLLNKLDVLSKNSITNEGSNKIKLASRNLPMIIRSNKGGNNEYAIRVSNKDGIAPEALNKLLRSRAFRNGFEVVSTPVKDRKGNYSNGMLRFIPKNGDFDSVKAQNNINSLTSKLDRYIDFDNFENKSHKYLDVGTNPELIRILRNNGFNNIINGRLYVPTNGKQNDEKRMLAKAQGIVKTFNDSHIDTINRIGNAASSYVVDGNGKGLNEVSRSFDPNTITRRFKTINNARTINAINGLANMGSKAGVVSEARQIQNDINSALSKQYGGPYQLAQEYIRESAAMNSGLSARANKIVKAMDDTVKGTGTTNINQMSQMDKSTLNRQLRDLEDELKKDSKLNLLQTNLISKVNDPNIRDIIARRKNLIAKSQLSNVDANRAFKNLTPGEIGEYVSTLSRNKGGIRVDKNGILSIEMDANTRNAKREVDRISSVIKAVSQG